ncbi:MAG: helix-turn-helix transcriptional regulator [Myxococcales bacterium]|nr:helix-turn-helix transcriptional regulator [Myxococcales bacterium]
MSAARAPSKAAPEPAALDEGAGLPEAPAGELLVEGDEVGAAELTRRVADNLRALRKRRELSLDELATRSGVSRATLSQIETCKTNPTIAILWKIAAGLGVPFASLLGNEEVERVRVLRRGDSQVLRSADGRMESRPLTPAGASPMVECYELRLQARGLARSEPHARGTCESLVVLTGVLKLHVADQVYELAAGDSVFFEADVAHAYENPGRTEARYHNVILYAR